MTAAEHFAEAERLLALSQDELELYARAAYGSKDETAHLQQSIWVANRAQVHATLALAAVPLDAAEWKGVIA